MATKAKAAPAKAESVTAKQAAAKPAAVKPATVKLTPSQFAQLEKKVKTVVSHLGKAGEMKQSFEKWLEQTKGITTPAEFTLVAREIDGIGTLVRDTAARIKNLQGVAARIK